MSLACTGQPMGWRCWSCRLCNTVAQKQKQRQLPRSRRRFASTIVGTTEAPRLDEIRHDEDSTQKTISPSRERDGVLDIMHRRGYINQIVGENDVTAHTMSNKSVGVYLGIDPTASSLHVGHLVPLMALYWMATFGFPTWTLLGNATASIGDPSFRSSEREQQSQSTRIENSRAIFEQLHKLREWMQMITQRKLKLEKKPHNLILDNSKWHINTPGLKMLGTVGRALKVGAMLGRDSVQQRMSNGEGMSLAEFCYPMMQAFDWYRLYKDHNVHIQIGGSDQFGNILAGMEAVRTSRKASLGNAATTSKEPSNSTRKLPCGFTTPLLTTSSGEKFGKSAGNAVWLDGKATSPFELYQFFLRLPDADVPQYLKLLTFEPLAHIATIMEQHAGDASQRIAQHALALEVVTLVHGEAIATSTRQEHQLLFQPRMPNPSMQKFSTQHGIVHTIPANNTTLRLPDVKATLPLSLVRLVPLAKVLYHAGLVASRKEGQRLCSSGGAYIGAIVRPQPALQKEEQVLQVRFTPHKDLHTPKEDGTGGDVAVNLITRHLQPKTDATQAMEKILILRAGKTHIGIIRVVDDTTSEQAQDRSGYDFVGMEEYFTSLSSSTK